MDWTKHYRSPALELWQGRDTQEQKAYNYQCVQCVDLLAEHEFSGDVALIGFACDAGVLRNQGRAGAADGPAVLRQHFSRLANHHNLELLDMGDVVCSDGNVELAQSCLAEVVSFCRSHHLKTLVLGGGHETAYGHYKGCSQAHHHPVVINFDAHFDLRSPIETGASSGTPFRQIADEFFKEKQFPYYCIGIQPSANTTQYYQAAQDLGVKFMEASLMQSQSQLIAKLLLEAQQLDQGLYVSLCLDVFAASVAPGVSAPQPAGIYPQHIWPWLMQLAASGKVQAFDIVELAPKLDCDNQTAGLAAQCLNLWLQHWR